MKTVREPETSRALELGPAPGSVVFCSDLADCPELRGPLMGGKSGLIVPDYERLARAYSDANWKWCVSTEKWSKRKAAEPDGMDIVRWMDAGESPTPDELRAEIAKRVGDLEEKPGCFIMSGGLTIFRTLSGGVGCALDWLLVEHYKRTAPTSQNTEVRHARASADAAPRVGPSHENP